VTFLAPMVGLAAAAICVPLLLALYFLKLRRRPVRVSSTFLWQQAVRDLQANVPFRWLRFNWLLLLQLLILACLIVAAARPVIPATGPASGRTVLIIDTSASMSALDGDRAYRPRALASGTEAGGPATAPITRLDEARARAERMIDALSGDQQMMIVRFAGEATILSPMTDDRQVLREALERVTPTDQPGDPLRAIRLVRAVLDRPQDESFEGGRALVLLASDGGIPEYDQTPSHAREIASALAGVNLALVRCGPSPGLGAGVSARPGAGGVANAGIVSISARRDFEDPATVRVFARVINSAEARVNTQLVLSLGGRVLERRAIEVPAAGVGAAGAGAGAANSAGGPNAGAASGGRARAGGPAAEVGADGGAQPGELNVTFTITEPLGGLILLRLADADILAADDVAGVVVAPLASPRVLMVSPKGSADADGAILSAIDVSRPASLEVIDEAAYRVRLAAANAGARGGVAGGANAGVGGSGNAGGLGLGGGIAGAFDGIDAVILDRVSSEPAPPVASIHFASAVVSRTPPRRGDEAPVRIGAEAIAMVPTSPDAEPELQRVLSWDRDHPLMRYASLETIFVSPPWRLTVPSEQELARGNLAVTELATSAMGPLVMLVRDSSPGMAGGGRPVDRIAIAFPLARSNWGPHFSFPIFLSNAIDLFARRAEARVGRWYGTSQVLTFTPALGAPEISLSSDKGVVARAPIAIGPGGAGGAGGDNAARSLGVIDRVGIYRVSGAEKSETGGQEVVAVNLANVQESMARTFDEVRLSIDAPITGQARIDAPPAGREIWHWFIAGAMALLLIEWLLYAWLMHR
jgi:hypothetical protein